MSHAQWFRSLVVLIGLAGTLSLLSCQTSGKRHPELYVEALELARTAKGDAGKILAAQEALLQACRAGAQAACVQSNTSGVDERSLRRVPILQGLTSETSTQFSIVVPLRDEILFTLWNVNTKRLYEPISVRSASRSYSPYAAVTLRFEDLKPGDEYRLDLALRDGRLLDSRRLRLFQTKGERLSFALISCMNDTEVDAQKRIWPEVLAQRPEMLFLIGDTVYVDVVDGRKQTAEDPRQIWERYIESRQRLALYRAPELIPTVMIWDDHDTGLNDATSAYPLLRTSAEIFRAFAAQDPIPGVLTAGPGLAFEFQARGQRFFFLDNRSFRSRSQNPRAQPTPVAMAPAEQSHFGPEQEDWLARGLAAASDPAWLISGDQFFGGYHRFESYEGDHPAAFARFLQRLKKMSVAMVFASGDRHLAEIMQIPQKTLGYRTYELTSSGIHTKQHPRPLDNSPNPRGLVLRGGVINYMLVRSQAGRDGRRSALKLSVGSYSQGNEVLFQRELDISR